MAVRGLSRGLNIVPGLDANRHRVVIVLYIQPLPVNPGVKDGTSARSIPVIGSLG